MKKINFFSLLTSISLILSSLPGFAMEETSLEENNLTYGCYVQKHIPPGMQSIFQSDSENPEVMTFIFLQRIAQRASTVDKEAPEFIKMVQNSQEGFPQRDSFLQNLKAHFFWIEKVAPDYFKESYEPHKAFLKNLGVQFPRSLSDIAEYAKMPGIGVVKTPLTPMFRSLGVGISEENNTRNHNPHTTYMINLSGGHVQDDLTLLSSRKYLDLDGKPYEFDSIYIEVCALHKFWLFPEVLEFFNRHLIMGGKLILELADDPNNPLSFETSTVSMDPKKWAESFGDGVSEVQNDYFGRTLIRKTIELRGRKSEALSIKYPKEFTKIKELLMFAGFDHIKKSDLPVVQFGTNPYEMLKVK